MLKLSQILFTIAFLFSMYLLPAQTNLGFLSGFPLKQVDSPLFGKDIVINDQPDQDQRNVVMCSAFNGWLFAAFVYDTLTIKNILIMKSIDKGLHWSRFYCYQAAALDNQIIPTIDLITSGNDQSNLKVFLGLICQDILNDGIAGSAGNVIRFNGVTGEKEGGILSPSGPGIKHLDLCSDVNYPANAASPGSIAILYSRYIYGIDSICIRTSSNGGISFDNWKGIAYHTGYPYYRKVSLAYGRSPLWNSGRYFATWEVFDYEFSETGHIYYAHSEPNYNSSFTTPFCLDSLDPSNINLCRNPLITCQYGEMDNDDSNLTSLILFENYNSATYTSDIIGYYNKQSTLTNNFQPFSFPNPSPNNVQPDVAFNPYNSTFMATYFVSNDHKLSFLSHDFNMANPSSWNIASSGYNDGDNIIAPYPKVNINFMQQEGMNTWIAEGPNGKGIAMFDAPYSTWTGISEINKANEAGLISVYPNPCSNELEIVFELKKTEKVIIHVLSILGQNLGTVTNQFYSEGKHVVKINVSTFPAGTYLYNFNSGDGVKETGRFSIIR
jgi:hypothetical protein